MKITPKQYALALYEEGQDKRGKQLNVVVDNFIKILISNRDLKKIKEIIKHFIAIWHKKEHVLEVEIISARPFHPRTNELLNNYLRDLTGAVKIIHHLQIDSRILAGAIIKYEDKVIDYSLRAQLELLKNKMAK